MDAINKMNDTLAKDGNKAAERVRDAANAAWEKGTESWKELRDQGQQAISQSQKGALEVWDDAQKLLQKHPGKAIGAALLFGAAIGALLVLGSRE